MIATPVSALDAPLAELRAGASRWIKLLPAEKATLLAELRTTVHAEAKQWAQAGAQAKGIAGSPLAGEEWISGPWAVLYALNRYIETLESLAKTSTVALPPKSVRERNAQVVVDVFPRTAYDRVLLSGIRAEVRMTRDVTVLSLPETLGTWYRDPNPQPRVALVLGAGNVSSIAPLDVLYKLLADGAVCVLKMNPVNDYLGPVFERALRPLVREGFLRFVYGGAEIGKALCAHPLVDEIHITGSDKTHDRIVFGDGPDFEERKRTNRPVLTKPITSELGNVSPTIVVPGTWSDADFTFQAEQIVTQKLHNAGFNCIASQVLILPEAWHGSTKLLERIAHCMDAAADRPAYYPGAHARVEALVGEGSHRPFGKADASHTTRSLVVVDAGTDSAALHTEAFASVLAVVLLPGEGAEYVRNAVSFANDRLWGTLGGNIIAHPQTIRDLGEDFERAVDDLRYGCVAVNTWTGVGYFIAEATWGAYPGHTIDDVRSGIGVVHNSFLFSKPEKTVVYGPFAPFPRSIFGYGATLLPKPPWFVTNRLADRIAAALVEYEMQPSVLSAAKVAALAMRA